MAIYLITGGCGFIGSNLAYSLLKDGHRVVCCDNLHRKGAERNLAWLQSLGHESFQHENSSVTDFSACQRIVGLHRYDAIFHLAGQVAVTTAIENPREDFEINALGTFNVLEAVRLSGQKMPFFFTSTNKVYGEMSHVPVIEVDGAWDYDGLPLGVSENELLDFHSPYGCSKGTADQYVRDYGRIYGIPTVVFRMSCQFGPRQFGNEDQGWVAHFVIAAGKGVGLNIYGDGKQVRDILYIEDLVRAFRMALENISVTQGKIYNIGGGRENTISLLELVEILEKLSGAKMPLTFADWRPGDQKVYISDIRKACAEFGWKPANTKQQGVAKLYQWVLDNRAMFSF